MKTLLAEQPILVAIMLGVIGLGLLFGWLQTGKRAAALAGLVALVLIPVSWSVSLRWVTDRELIREAIRSTAEAVERNDRASAVSIIADPRYRELALAELPRFEFAEARVTGERHIRVQEDAFPPTAEADINVRVEVSGRGLGAGRITVPRRLILKFEKFGEDWKVMEYQHRPIVGGPDQFSKPLVP